MDDYDDKEETTTRQNLSSMSTGSLRRPTVPRVDMHRVSGWHGEETTGGNWTDNSGVIRQIPLRQSVQKDSHPQEEPRTVWDPDGNFLYNWMVVISIAALYNIVVIILRLAFMEMRENVVPGTLFAVLDIGCDLVYLLDIFVQHRVSYYEDGCLISDISRVSVRYRGSTRFKFDVLSILPFQTTLHACQGVLRLVFIDIGFQTYYGLYTSISRLPRLLKAYIVSEFFNITDSRTSNPNCVRAFKLSLYLALVIHWIGCLYYIVSVYEGLGSTEWAYSSGNYEDNFTRKYVCCIYWSLLILTTIGERPPPQTNLEHVFTGLTFVIGVFIFAAVVGNVGDVISNLNASRQEFQARMDQIKFYMTHRNVPVPLQDRVKRWADYTWTRNQAMDDTQLLQILPERLQMEIAIQVHLETLKKVTIFEECEEGLLRELVLKLRSQIFSPGDYICHIGDIGREMYIINHGKIEIIVTCADTGQKKVVATLGAGNYFGEISLLKLDSGQNRRTADVRSVGYSELLRLCRKDLLTALVEYPEAKNILETQAKQRMKETKVIQNTNGEKLSSPELERQVTEKSAKRKRDWFGDIVRSENFKRLMESKGTELSELKTIVRQLKDFHAQMTEKSKLHSTEKCKRLEVKLQQCKFRLRKANEKIETLQEALTYSCKCDKSPKSVVADSQFANRSNRSSLIFGKAKLPLRKKFPSEHYLERKSVTSSTCSDGGNEQLRQRMLERNDNPKPKACTTSAQSSETSQPNQPEPVRQSSGYSSDTETMATLLRVSDVLRLRHCSLSSSDSICDSSDVSDDVDSEWEEPILTNCASQSYSNTIVGTHDVLSARPRSCYKETNV